MNGKPIPVFAADRYLVADDGTHAYPLTGYWAKRVQPPDGARIVEIRKNTYQDPEVSWLVTPGPLDHITTAEPDRTETTGYEIVDPAAASEKFPPTLGPGELTERYGDEDTADGYMARRIYRRTTRTVPGDVTDHSTSSLTVLAGAVDEHPDRGWIADQPGALVYSANFHHLLPGRMTGLRDAVKAALQEMFGGRTSLLDNRGGVYDAEGRDGKQLEVTLSLPYSPPRHYTKQAYTRSGRKATGRAATTQAESFQTITVSVRLDRNAAVAAPSKAEAVAAFQAEVDAWVDWVGTFRMAVCSHCNGEGHLSMGGKSPSRVRAERAAAANTEGGSA